MDCFKPIYIDDPDQFAWNSYARSHGLEHSVKKISVPCGHCEACVYSAAQEWRVRITEEFNSSQNAVFFTLTYNDECLPLSVGTSFDGERVVVPCVSKRDIQLFLKRLREYYRQEFNYDGLRYYICSEYGPTTFRPHYHGILFNIPNFEPRSEVSLHKVTETICDKWSNGFVKLDLVNPARIGYITKYLSCTMDLPCEYVRPFRLMSRRPAIGSTYFDKTDRISWHKNNLACYIPDGSFKLRMPRYYKRKIFDDDEITMLRQLYLDKLNKIQEQFDFESDYNDFCHGISKERDKRDKFIRNFNRKYKKSRKDV